METTANRPAGSYYDENSKEFLAAYYSTARHNAYLALNQILLKCGSDPLENDDEIRNLQTKYSAIMSKGTIIKSRFIELLHEHFPFLESINLLIEQQERKLATTINEQPKTEYNKERNVNALSDFFSLLNSFRNYYAHSYVPQPPLPEYFDARLYAVFDTNLNKVKESFFGKNGMYDNDPKKREEDIQHLRRKILADPKVKGKKKELKDNPDFHYSFRKNNQLTIYGHLFFCSLFLEKRDAMEMQKKIKGLKRSDNDKYKITNEVFCWSHIRLPKHRLDSQFGLDTLSMDLHNELAKAPSELYNQLNESDKVKFMSIPENITNDPDDSYGNEKTSGVRYQSRFTYLALRYLDETSAFTSIRFQIDLGHYHYHFYEASINGNTEQRRLSKKLLGYGRIQEMTAPDPYRASNIPSVLPETWKDFIKDPDYSESIKEPHIPYTRPHYHLEDGKIGLKFHVTAPSLPSLEIKPDHPSPYPKLKRKEQDHGEIADAFLSLNEVPYMTLCCLLLGSEKTEEHIRSKYNALKMFLKDLHANKISPNLTESDLQTNYKLRSDELPERIRHYLNGKEPALNISHIAQNRLNALKDETRRKTDAFKKLTEKNVSAGKRQYRRLESGKYAQWLAEDILRFQPIASNEKGEHDLRSKANPTKFQLLQKTLALYNTEKQNLKGLLIACRLIDSSNPHPFLKPLVQKLPDSWMTFYTLYLEARKNFLNQIKYPSDQKHHYFLKMRNREQKTIAENEGWLKQIYLPTGMFSDLLTDYFKSHDNQTLRDIPLNKKGVPTLYSMLKTYLGGMYQDAFQSFYETMPLHYRIYNEKTSVVYNQKQREDFWKNHKSVYQKSRKIVQDFEAKHKDWPEKFEKAKEEIVKDGITGKTAIYNRLEHVFKTTLPPFVPKSGKATDDTQVLEHCKAFLLKAADQKLVNETRFMLDNEERIRGYKTEDAILSLILRNLLDQSSVNENAQDFRLSAVEPIGVVSKNNFLNQIIPLTYTIPVYQMNEQGGFCWLEGETKKDRKKIELGKVIIESRSIKVKNRGTFLHRLKDRRLNNLLQYLTSLDRVTVDRKRIEQELKLYDNYRVEMVKQFLEIEGQLVKHIDFDRLKQEIESRQSKQETVKEGGKEHQNKKEREAHPTFKDILYAYQSHSVNLEDRDKKQLVGIRNAFLHNQYPLPELFPDIKKYHTGMELPEKEGLGIISQICFQGKELCDTIIKSIK